ncbi:calcium uniporter protein, mitochondrial-like [Mytilus edulis]|uniref:calcium uniporter protein, mitochondrial-like n=1 Tax=Mytilus trossulus TaxID=6551 RepID=UPI0030046263
MQNFPAMATRGLSLVVRRVFLHHKKLVKSSSLHRIVQFEPVCPCSYYCTTALFKDEATVVYRDGLPVFSVPLPSRRQSCEFTMKPVTHTVGKFLSFLKEEDGGIDRAAIFTEEGARVAQSTTIDTLLRYNSFQLVLNDQKYQVVPPSVETMTNEDLATLSDVKTLIGQLYSQLNVDQHQFEQEKVLVQKLEELKLQVQPYEKVKVDIEGKALKRTTGLAWVGLGLMSLQFGVLARLTWWEYSWDIMEPVTYFITYGTSVAMFAYFVLTRQEYNYETLRDRQYLIGLHKNAKKSKMSVETYNKLKEEIAKVEYDIKRLRDPLQLRVPLREVEYKPEQ